MDCDDEAVFELEDRLKGCGFEKIWDRDTRTKSSEFGREAEGENMENFFFGEEIINQGPYVCRSHHKKGHVLQK